jgi:hypothetical protein
MLLRQLFLVSIVASISSQPAVYGQQVRYYQQNGVTYCETYQTVQRPITETSMQQTTRTVYKDQYYTETKDVTQNVWCPVTYYRAENYWVGRWNPFVEPYVETEWIPETCWRRQTQTVKMPITCRRIVPEEQKVVMPVTTQRIVSQDYVLNRVAIADPPIQSAAQLAQQTNPQNNSPPTPAQSQPFAGPQNSNYNFNSQISNGQQIGGIARLREDPPRYGTTSASTIR